MQKERELDDLYILGSTERTAPLHVDERYDFEVDLILQQDTYSKGLSLTGSACCALDPLLGEDGDCIDPTALVRWS